MKNLAFFQVFANVPMGKDPGSLIEMLRIPAKSPKSRGEEEAHQGTFHCSSVQLNSS